MTSSHSAKISQVVSAVAGVAGAAAGIALAPIVTPALLSIVGVKAATGKLPPQVDQPARYHLTPREPLGTLAVGKVALGGSLPVAALTPTMLRKIGRAHV